MTQLYEIKVRLSPNQKKNLGATYHKKETIVLRLTKDSLSGKDTLLVPQSVLKRLEKNKQQQKGMDIKLAKTNIRKQVGGSLLSTVLAFGKTFAPTIAKTLGLSALAGLASEGASQVVKKISGNGFLVPQDKINQLIMFKHLLSTKQKKDLVNALQTGSGVHMKPTKTQKGGFLGTLLASIGVPLILNALTGSGAPQMGQPKQRLPRSLPTKPSPSNKKDGGLINYRSPPFFGNWPDQTIGMGAEKTKKPKKKLKKKLRKRAKVCYLVKIHPSKTSLY